MQKETALALQQKVVGNALSAVIPGDAAIVEKLIGPVCDAIKTCFCKDEIAKIELRKIWASIAPQYLKELDKFLELMGQFIDAVSEYDKLTLEQTNMIIGKIFDQPDVPFAEKNAAIQEYMRMQYAHKENQTKNYLAGGIGASVIAAGVAVTKVLSDNKTKQAIGVAKVAKTAKIVDGITAFTPAGTIKSIGDVAVKILKTMKK